MVSGETGADATYFDHPGVAIVASSGDDGYGVSYPAACPDVVAVGGTSLHQATDIGTRNATETVWSGAGSGCSAYEPKPAWQTDTGCARRTVADVSAVADPNTGVWVYDSAAAVGSSFGGTSVAAPIVGALYALAGNAASTTEMGSLPYATPTALNDVTSGSNGSCGGSYLCTGIARLRRPDRTRTQRRGRVRAGWRRRRAVVALDRRFRRRLPTSRLRRRRSASMQPGATANEHRDGHADVRLHRQRSTLSAPTKLRARLVA